jgi:hypothetical protein
MWRCEGNNQIANDIINNQNPKPMKKSIALFAFLFTGLFAASILVMSCSGKKAEQTEETGHQHAEGDSTSQNAEIPMDSTQTAYACPMHPEITGKEGDKCSKCKMALEAMKKEHQH